MEVWEYDLIDMQALSKNNDKYKYLLRVIDTSPKYLHIVPLRSKTGTVVSSAFRSILANISKPVRRYHIWVRTDRCKEFLNRTFQAMLRKEGIQFKVCRYPNVIFAIMESSHRRIRDKLYKYITYGNTYRYLDVLPQFVWGYNDTVHSATGMAPSKVTDSNILVIWYRMRSNIAQYAARQSHLASANTSESVKRNSNSPRAASKTTQRKYSK